MFLVKTPFRAPLGLRMGSYAALGACNSGIILSLWRYCRHLTCQHFSIHLWWYTRFDNKCIKLSWSLNVFGQNSFQGSVRPSHGVLCFSVGMLFWDHFIFVTLLSSSDMPSFQHSFLMVHTIRQWVRKALVILKCSWSELLSGLH